MNVILRAISLLQHHRQEAFPIKQSPEFAAKVQIKVKTKEMSHFDYSLTEHIALPSLPTKKAVIFSFFLFLDTMTCNSKPLKPNGKLEVPVEVVNSPPRTTLLGTIFSPVFNFFSPATKTGKNP